MLTLATAKPQAGRYWEGVDVRTAVAALALALSGLLASTGIALAAFQTVHLSVTSGEPGVDVSVRVDGSLLIGGSEHSELFLVSKDAYDASPEPAHCDEIPGATAVGALQWHAATVAFQGKTYPGFVGTGSFTVPDVATGIYVISGILDNQFTGCHPFALFGVGMDLPDTAADASQPISSILSLGGLALLIASLLLARLARRDRLPGR
jgi:hypothetical protein